MTYKPTFLNITAGLYLIGCLVYTILNYRELSYEEGWGVVAMVGLAGLGGIALLADVLIQVFVKDGWVRNLIGILIAIIMAVLIIKG